MSDIDLKNRGLKTLKGQDIPDFVDGTFNCGRNKLTSLEFGPIKARSYYCFENKLTSLEFGPIEITHGDFHCGENQLTSIKFCPTKINGDLHSRKNEITNFKDIHKQFKNGYIKGAINFDDNPVTSHLLGLILIPKLLHIQDRFLEGRLRNASLIINRHIRNERDVLDCQEELIQEGFKDFAQL